MESLNDKTRGFLVRWNWWYLDVTLNFKLLQQHHNKIIMEESDECFVHEMDVIFVGKRVNYSELNGDSEDAFNYL